MVTSENITEQWAVTKAAVYSRGGLVATNHADASEIGAEVLRAGGNAVDAAVAVSFAIGIVEPWNSGLGGCGFVQVFDASSKKVTSLDFGTVAPRGVNPDDYPLTGGTSDGGFGWPAVIDDRNFIGPYSVGVPTVVSGMATLLKDFGTRSWRESLEPAVLLAERGMWIDWYATLIIAYEAATIARYPSLAEVYLPGGYPPAAPWDGGMPRLNLDALAATLKRLSVAGPEDFYSGEIAAKIDGDARRAGCPLRQEDLADFRTTVCAPSTGQYRGATIHSAPGLSAGPTLLDALRLLEAHDLGSTPDAATYLAVADSLFQAYETRLATMGEVSQAQSSTTNFSVIDGDGNMVVVTQTLMSTFGSMVRLPETGVILNNGMLWFDPVPGRINSIAPGKRPLSNMAPTVVVRDDKPDFALGASGGRRIFPALFQLILFIHDFDMNLNNAFQQPRIDVSGGPGVTVDPRLGDGIVDAIAAKRPIIVEQSGVRPTSFATPNAVMRDKSGDNSAIAHIATPWPKVVAA